MIVLDTYTRYRVDPRNDMFKLNNVFFSLFFVAIAVQHERKPLLDKKEAAAAAAAAALVANNSANTGGDLSGMGAFTSQARSGSGTNAKYSRNEFISSPTGGNMGNLGNLFPVGISFAELTSTLAQRGSEYTFFLFLYQYVTFTYSDLSY